MCGIFGFVRPRGATAGSAGTAFAEIGHLAMARGTDAAGWATLAHPRRVDWRVVKAPVAFDRLWATRTTRDVEALASARVAMGHTRAASQGAVGRMANCSPMAVGPVLGTHNGDIDADHLAKCFGISRSHLAGETDTEVLLAALGRARAIKVLEAATGRVALVWADRRQPGRLWLARGAWSPLYIGRDDMGTLWWGSAPSWLARAGVSQVLRVPEGTLVAVDLARATFSTQRFRPTARLRDEWAGRFVYAGIGVAEAEQDARGHVHRVRTAMPGQNRTWYISRPTGMPGRQATAVA